MNLDAPRGESWFEAINFLEEVQMKKSLTVAAAVTAALAVAPAAFGWGDGSYGGGGGSYGGWDGGSSSNLRAASYINPDTTSPTNPNRDVDPNSSCFRPDQYDMQMFSSPGSGNPGDRNVHNDACFLDDNGNKVGKNIGATFQSSGTGYISACPDPDGTGTAARSIPRDLNGDGRNDSCYQSSYQETGKAGDFEYHARVNNTGMAGSQSVKWGMDRDADGRIDGYDDDSIKVDWSATGTSSFSYRR